MTQQGRTTTRGAYDRTVRAWSPPKAPRACARNLNAGRRYDGILHDGYPTDAA